MDWIQRMNLVLDYIENNLDSEIEENKIAELSASPKGMFQRIFSILTDMSLSEYIRKRRLTQAVFDIQNSNEKILDIAIKYGYNSADAFGFAFKAFHGITPSDAKKSDVELKFFYPLVFEFKLSIKGGNDMQSRIIETLDVKAELGRANILDKEIVVELGRAKTPEEQLKETTVGDVIMLDKKVKDGDVEPLDVLVNGLLTANGHIIVDNGIFHVKIIEVLDSENNIADLKMGDVIELDKKTIELHDIFANGKLIAKGDVVICDGNFSVRIQEI